MKALWVLAVLLFSASPVAAYSAFFSDYVPASSETNIQLCAQPTVADGDLALRLVFDLDQPSPEAAAYCFDGIYAKIPYERRLWLLRDDYELLESPFWEVGLFEVSNSARLLDVFAPAEPNTPFINADRFRLASPGLTRQANEFLQYDEPSNLRYNLRSSSLMYALARGHVNGGEYYNTLSSSWASQDAFAAAGMGYPPADLSNPSNLLDNGGLCGSFRCINTGRVDVDFNNDAGGAFFAFSPDMNYYHLPFFFEEVRYRVRFFDENGSQIYSRSGEVPSTSNAVYAPPLSYSVRKSRALIPDSVFDYGSSSRFDGVIADVPEGAAEMRLSFSVRLLRNAWYRHESPADASWSWGNLSPEFSSLVKDTFGDITLQFDDTYNLSTFNNPVGAPDYASNDTSLGWNQSVVDGGLDPVEGGGGVGAGGSSHGVEWARDPNAGGGLQGQYAFAEGLMVAESKHSFFEVLSELASTIFRLILTLLLLVSLVVAVYACFLMVPSAYRKLLQELRRLGGGGWA